MQVRHQNIGLDLYIFQNLFLFFKIFPFCLLKSFIYFSPVKQQTPRWEVVVTWKWLHLSSVFCIHNSSLCATALHFSKAQFFNEMMCEFQSNNSSSEWQSGQNPSSGCGDFCTYMEPTCKEPSSMEINNC